MYVLQTESFLPFCITIDSHIPWTPLSACHCLYGLMTRCLHWVSSGISQPLWSPGLAFCRSLLTQHAFSFSNWLLSVSECLARNALSPLLSCHLPQLLTLHCSILVSVLLDLTHVPWHPVWDMGQDHFTTWLQLWGKIYCDHCGYWYCLTHLWLNLEG